MFCWGPGQWSPLLLFALLFGLYVFSYVSVSKENLVLYNVPQQTHKGYRVT